ncbi:flagellar biosynthetic protein FliO [Lysobacter auxotrophicus]|uniref:Flagellar protein n=1 Tax=Lysobacter auxotrophicus TaxID=2992573 RepID=A0ABN6UN91_9GAMM|nr:flagellar biosynthetic protein FliO [Lysobacter auxotrophicus]
MAFEGTRADGAQAVPSHPLHAGGGAKSVAIESVPGTGTQHTATLGHPAKPQTFSKQPEGPGVGGAVFALILVVSLILALGWLAKRMPGFGRATGGGSALRVVGSLTLGPRDRVVVVDVGGTQLLLGVGQNGMTTLHTLSEPLPVAQPSQGNPGLQNLATPFAQLLQKHLGKKP